jgi:hypothetical protein
MMTPRLQKAYRLALQTGLLHCTDEQHQVFTELYDPNQLAEDLDNVIATLPSEKLMDALTEVQKAIAPFDEVVYDIHRYGVGDIFVIINNENLILPIGQLVQLIHKDNTTEPFFSINGDVSCLPLHSVAPITKKKKPIVTVHLDDDDIFILGRPNFACAKAAKTLIQAGVYADKEESAEYEQAVFIHWSSGLRAEHGDTWRIERNRLINEYELIISNSSVA